jgi:hypothetical protein
LFHVFFLYFLFLACLSCLYIVGSRDVLSERLKSKSGVVNATVDNPLCDISNVGSHSGSCAKDSHLDGDVILIDKENITIPNSVFPSPFRHRSRCVRSKVFFLFLCLLFCPFWEMLTFFFRFHKVLRMDLRTIKMRLVVVVSQIF